MQEVTVSVSEVWLDEIGLPSDGDLSFVVLGTGIGADYNPAGRALLPGSEIVVFVEPRAIGWREGGYRPLLCPTGAYQGVYRVAGDGGLTCAAESGPLAGARSRSVHHLYLAVQRLRMLEEPRGGQQNFGRP